MNNRDRAAEVIWEEQLSGIVKPRYLVDALADAGLLMSELDGDEWEYGVQSRECSENADWGHFAIPFEKQRTRESCEQFIKGRLGPRFEYRLVRRRVSQLEEA